METLNPGFDLDLAWVNNAHLNHQAIKRRAQQLTTLRPISDEYRIAWLLKALTLIDLTTLNADDTKSNVSRLCHKAARPISQTLTSFFGFGDIFDIDCPIKTAAVCVYPAKVKYASKVINSLNLTDKIRIASVAAGFPSGQYPLSTRLDEIKYAIEQGANEIDIVIDRSLVSSSDWSRMYDEIKQMKQACQDKAHLKTILAVGELNNVTNIYKASLVAMMAGSDFIKTSTGKESVNATLLSGIVMARAIKDYCKRTGLTVGLKPAGGIRTANDAISWLVLIKEELDNRWLDPELFRFGASGLLGDIEKELYKYSTSRNPASYQISV